MSSSNGIDSSMSPLRNALDEHQQDETRSNSDNFRSTLHDLASKEKFGPVWSYLQLDYQHKITLRRRAEIQLEKERLYPIVEKILETRFDKTIPLQMVSEADEQKIGTSGSLQLIDKPKITRLTRDYIRNGFYNILKPIMDSKQLIQYVDRLESVVFDRPRTTFKLVERRYDAPTDMTCDYECTDAEKVEKGILVGRVRANKRKIKPDLDLAPGESFILPSDVWGKKQKLDHHSDIESVKSMASPKSDESDGEIETRQNLVEGSLQKDFGIPPPSPPLSPQFVDHTKEQISSFTSFPSVFSSYVPPKPIEVKPQSNTLHDELLGDD